MTANLALAKHEAMGDRFKALLVDTLLDKKDHIFALIERNGESIFLYNASGGNFPLQDVVTKFVAEVGEPGDVLRHCTCHSFVDGPFEDWDICFSTRFNKIDTLTLRKPRK